VSVGGSSTSRGAEVTHMRGALKEEGHISGVLELVAVSHPHPTRMYGQEQSMEDTLHSSAVGRR